MPYLGSTLFVVVLVVSLLVAVNAYFLLVRSLAPAFVARARARGDKHPILTVLLGAVAGGLTAIVAILLLSVPHPLVRFLGGIVATLGLAVAFGGAAAFATRIGAGLASTTDEGRPWFQTLKGGIVLELAMLLPFLGWFLIVPLTVFGGFGAAILGLFPARHPSPAAAVEDARSAS